MLLSPFMEPAVKTPSATKRLRKSETSTTLPQGPVKDLQGARYATDVRILGGASVIGITTTAAAGLQRYP